MKRQFKAAAVVSTAALLAIGASFTSMAASQAKTGTWVLEADGWYCYDKNGTAYENEWCYSYGKKYFVGDDGLLVTNAWIEDEDKYYFVGSTGSMTVNDWRYVTPADSDEEDEQWFYFNAKGEMETGKKVINGKTYYFDQNGVMLTGWVEYTDGVAQEADAGDVTNVTYCDENGARLSEEWVQTWAPGVDPSEVEDDDIFWYYVRSNGNLRRGKAADIKGRTYLFNDEGQMLTGWVLAEETTGDNVYDVYSEHRTAIAHDSYDHDLQGFFFCDEEEGYVKKDRWVKTWTPEAFEEQDEDTSKYWYWVQKGGEVYIPEYCHSAQGLDFVDGEFGLDGFESSSNATASDGYFQKPIGNKTYAFKSNGAMWTGFVNVYYGDDGVATRYYHGGSSDGKMATGTVSIPDEDGVSYKFHFADKDKTIAITEADIATDANADGKISKDTVVYTTYQTKGAGVTGAADKSLYNKGMLVTAKDYKYEWKWVDLEVICENSGDFEDLTVGFIVNNNGVIQTAKKDYKEDGDTLINKNLLLKGFVSDVKTGPVRGASIGDIMCACE